MIQDWNDFEYCLEAVKENGFALKWVKNQTPDICLEAVKQNGFALRFVINQTHEMCLEAVKRDGYAIEYVKEQTPEKNSPFSIYAKGSGALTPRSLTLDKSLNSNLDLVSKTRL